MRLFLTQNFSQLTLVNGIRRSGIGRDLLVSSHAGTRLPIAVIQAQGAPPQPATDSPWMPISPLLSRCTKPGDTCGDVSWSQWFHMTPYGGMIRIRFKGRSDTASSQLASQAPLCFDCICDDTPNISKMQWFFTQESPGRPPASWSGNPSPPLGAGSNRWRRPLGPARSLP